jgi:hypothetical protein
MLGYGRPGCASHGIAVVGLLVSQALTLFTLQSVAWLERLSIGIPAPALATTD